MPPRKHIDKQRIIEVSVELANELGSDGLTLASVAERLDIRIPSLYNHVAGLAGLRYELAVWGVRQLREEILRSVLGTAGDDALRSMAHTYRNFAHRHPGIYPMTLRAATADELELAQASQDLLDILLALLKPYQLSSDDMLHVIRAFRSLLHGFVDLENIGAFGLALNRDDSFQQLVELFISGLHIRQNQG